MLPTSAPAPQLPGQHLDTHCAPPERVSPLATPKTRFPARLLTGLMQRSATPSADADETPRDALTVLPLALPHTLTLRIWGALPCDVRLRCREVCPAWRDALAEPRLWSEVDLTETSGIVARVTPAQRRARGVAWSACL